MERRDATWNWGKWVLGSEAAGVCIVLVLVLVRQLGGEEACTGSPQVIGTQPRIGTTRTAADERQWATGGHWAQCR